MKIRTVNTLDISSWLLLSKEYDRYVQETAINLTEWYEGNDTSISFDKYMKAKIDKGEAFMAVNENNDCCGIIAISKKNNNITFWGVSHGCDFELTGELLLSYALSQLNKSICIKISEVKSEAKQIQKAYALLNRFGFIYLCDTLENGITVSCLERAPDCPQ